jgi:hypothetical protein
MEGKPDGRRTSSEGLSETGYEEGRETMTRMCDVCQDKI